MIRILRLLPTKWVVNVATLGTLGRGRWMPGTIGSLAGLIWYTVCFWNSTFFQFSVLILLSIFMSILFCGEAEIRIGEKDPSRIILDEFCAMPLCFCGIGRFIPQVATWKILFYGFLLFRFFDIVKPLGIRSLQDLKGGLGIVIDDVAAAAVTCIVLHTTVPIFFN
ncbi:MAG: phosphatidylglycerophosphatase A [Puniceicoccales bacterium]|jgi:phosphatidylglycerophosphatase A|nr:phosphatidylglycerophosphatase A [Puniceicoccales bacterium]